MRKASSRAISSKGLITHLTLSVAIPEPSGRILIVVAGSGTRFSGTRIFTNLLLGIAAMRGTAPELPPGRAKRGETGGWETNNRGSFSQIWAGDVKVSPGARLFVVTQAS